MVLVGFCAMVPYLLPWRFGRIPYPYDHCHAACLKVVNCLQVSGLPSLSTWARCPLLLANFFSVPCVQITCCNSWSINSINDNAIDSSKYLQQKNGSRKNSEFRYCKYTSHSMLGFTDQTDDENKYSLSYQIWQAYLL